jgi:CO/xanthine dehydrogenase FAD-binding subunit
MAQVIGYHRPETLKAALELLARTDSTSAVLAGGTVLRQSTCSRCRCRV